MSERCSWNHQVSQLAKLTTAYLAEISLLATKAARGDYGNSSY